MWKKIYDGAGRYREHNRLSSEDRVLDGLANGIEHLVHKAFSTDNKEAVFVILLKHREVISPSLVSLAHEILSIACKALKTQILRFKLRRADVSVEELASHRVDTSGSKFANRLIQGLLKLADKVRVNAHRLEQIKLRLSLRETIEDPTVHTAIRLADAVINKTEKNLIRNRITVLSSLLKLQLDGRVALSLVLQNLLWAHIDQAKRVSNHLRLSGLSTTRWAN